MSKKKSDKYSPITRNIAAAMSATIAATSVVSMLPANIASADEASAIAAVNAAATAADMKAALTRVDLALNLTGYDSLSAAGKDIVAQGMVDYRTANGAFGSQPIIQEQLNNEVARQQNVEILQNAIQAVNTAATSGAMRTALEDAALGLILTTYNNLSTPAGKLEAAQLLLDYRTANGSFASQADIQTQFNAAVQTTLDNEALAFAVKGVNDASDAAAMATALEDAYLGLVLASYHNLAVPDQAIVAQQLLDFKTSNGSFANKSAIQTKLNELVTQRALDVAYAAAVQRLNDTTTATDLQSALEASDLALNLTEYYKLNAAHRLAAAQAVLDYKVANGAFANQSSIQAKLSEMTAIEQVAQAVDVVNAAAADSSMKSALTSTVLALDLTVYTGLLAADQNAIVSHVLTNRGAGFADKAAVQSALNTAIAANAPMASVNLAGNAAAAEAALEAAALGLDQGTDYPTWDTADHAAVAEAVRTARPATGYVNVAAVQTAFDAAVVARTPVAAVNLAADEIEMEAALEAAGLGLTLGTNYSDDWLDNDRKAVAVYVLDTARPAGGFATQAAVQSAFDAAKLARANIAAVNSVPAVLNATNIAAMRSALEAVSPGLVLGDYASWTASDKDAVAGSVLQNLPGAGFEDLAAVQAAFDTALDGREAAAAVNIATNETGMQAALEAAGLALNLGATYGSWKQADKTAVAAEVLAARPADGYTTEALIQSAFDTAVSTVAPLANINGAGDAGEMQSALEAGSLGLTLGASYGSLSGASQTAVAQWVLDNRPTDGYADKPAVQAALNFSVSLEYVNIAATSAEMKAALEDSALGLTPGSYAGWAEADQLAVAAHVLTVRGGTAFTDKAAVQAEFDAGIAARTAVAAVNIAADAAEIKSALEAAALGLTLGSYSSWLAVDQGAVAAAVYAALPNDGYVDKAAVQTAFDNGVTARSPIAAVNNATDAAEIEAALEAGALALTLGDYAGWSDADQDAVSAYVLQVRPLLGFADKAAIQTAFDAGIGTREAVAAVNNAADAAAAKAALEDAALGLTLGVYTSWKAADKEAVAAAVYMATPGMGYADQAAVQSAFNTAVNDRQPIAAVNIASSEEAIKTALENATLALVQGAYASWTAADKAAVTGAVYDARPTDGFVDKAAVQSAFNTAIADRLEIASVNTAADVTEIKSALEDTDLGLDLSVYDGLLLADQWLVSDHVFTNRPATGFVDLNAVQLALDSAISADATMAAVNLASTEAEMETALENTNLGLTYGAYSGWKQADQTAVAAAVLDVRVSTGYANVAAVQAAFDNAVADRAPVAAVNNATTTAAVKTALEDALLALTLGDYEDWTPSDQSAVAAAVLGALPLGGYADEAAIQAVFNSAVTAREKVAAVNIAGTTAAAQTALEDGGLGLTLGAYTGWSIADKAAVAAAVRAARPTDGYVDQAAVQTAFSAALTARTAISAVNLAADAEETEAALEDAALGLTLGDYSSWSIADQAAVAEAVLGDRPTDGYADLDAIQSAFDTAADARKLIAAVNIATDAAEAREAIEALGLTLGDYEDWTAADKKAVAEDVLGDRPAGGYATAAAIQAVFDTALSDRLPVAAVNIATTDATIQAALQSVALDLDLTLYNTLGTADKLDVSSKVLQSRPADGFVDKDAIQDALDEALDLGTLIRDLNALEIGFAAGDSASRVRDDITLPSSGAGGSAIAWISDLPSVVSVSGSSGVVSRPAYLSGDAAVTLTAELTYKGETKTKEFVIKVIKEAITDSESVAADKAALDITFAIGDSAAAVTQNLTLPATGANGTTITWASSHTALIAADGNVTRPLKSASDQNVTLTATITKDGQQVTKVFNVNVLKQADYNDAEAVTTDKAALDIGYAPGDKAAAVTQSLSLPASGSNGTTIVWSSSDESIIDTNGDVNRPLKTEDDVLVTLTATITKNGQQQTKEFNVYVLKQTAYNDAESVAADKTALDVGYTAGDKATEVTQNLSLPSSGTNGTAIVWTSSHPSVVAANGVVTRPLKTEDDALVTLTATITKNGQQQTKEFNVYVLKETAYNDAESVAADKTALDVGYATGDKATEVTQNLSLPSSGTNGTAIVWTSSHPSVVAANGVVNRPLKSEDDVLVTLTATITKNGQQQTKEFNVYVLKQMTLNDDEAVAADKSALDVGYTTGDKATGVTQNLSLPTSGASGTSIVWTSSHPSIVSTSGAVNRPAKAGNDVLVTLTATITKNGQQQTKEFNVYVLKLTAYNDAESVAADKAALDISYATGDKASKVTQNLSLSLNGANGSTIVWTSSAPSVVSTNGEVTRPLKTESDALVTLTATIIKNGEQQTKEFNVYVLKETAYNDAESVAADKAALQVGFATGDKADSVTQNLSLPAIGANDSSIVWTSSHPSVVAANGVVNRPLKTEDDVLVTLTATITKNGQQQTKEFNVYVLKETAYNDAEAVAADKTALEVGYTAGDKATGVTQNLSLTSSGTNGTAIVWTSSHPSIVAANGVVTRPLKTAEDVLVTLTATITKNGQQQTKEFNVYVLKQTTLNAAESVAADKAALAVAFTGGETASGVTRNLSLPETGANGTTIAWSSSAANVVANDGTITRPAYLAGDATVTLTATIAKNGVSEQKTFQLVVLKNERTIAPLASNILIMNNSGNEKDLVEVAGLVAGDIVKVYNAAGTAEIGTATVSSNQTTASIQIDQLGTAGGSVLIAVKRGSLDESERLNVVFAAEGTKAFGITGESLDTSNGILAKVTITPTVGTAHKGKEVVIFQLMRGTTPVSIVVLEKDIVTAEQLSAHFNVSGLGYSVKVFVSDSYNGSLSDVGNSLAAGVVLQ